MDHTDDLEHETVILYDGHIHTDSLVHRNVAPSVDIENGGIEEPLLSSTSLKRGHSSAPNETSQIAMIGVNCSHIESLDYEIIENDVFKQDWRSKTRVQILQYIILKWTLACLVGASTGLVAFTMDLAVQNIAGVKTSTMMAYLKESRFAVAYSIFAGCNLLLVLVSSSLCAFIAPAAAGSGMPEVKAYLNGIDAPELFYFNTLIVKILGSICAVAGGLFTGKEGPMVHIGSCIASLLSEGGSRRYGLTWKWLRLFKNDRDRRDLVTCGAAAGVTAAFGAPVGGVLFALEEAASWWRSALLWRAFFTTASVAIVVRLGINYCKSGNCGMYGTGGLIMYEMGMVNSNVGLVELVPAAIVGLLGGFFGIIFTYFNGKIVHTYSIWHTKHGAMAKITHALLVSFFTSMLLFGVPWMASCTPCESSDDGNTCPTSSLSVDFKHFVCPSDQYNDLSVLLLNTNNDVVRILFSTNTSDVFLYSSLFTFLGVSFALALVTYGTAIPSGVFLPIIIIGATYGRITGKFMRSFKTFESLDEGLYAFLGAASLLGGTLRMTVSLCVILLELTNNLLMLPLTMLVLLISKTLGDLFSHNIYDQILHIKGLPLMEEKPQPYMKHLMVSDVCSSPPATFSAIERVGNIVELLKLTDHNAFPVLRTVAPSELQVLYGLILRAHLLVLLQRREFFTLEELGSGKCNIQFSSVDLAKPGPGKGPRIDDIEVTAEEKGLYLDLQPYTNTSPYTVVENMSLAKAFSLFRLLGLRHLLVMPTTSGSSPIVGILTRHDFMPEHVLGLYPHLESSKWNRIRVRPPFLANLQDGGAAGSDRAQCKGLFISIC